MQYTTALLVGFQDGDKRRLRQYEFWNDEKSPYRSSTPDRSPYVGVSNVICSRLLETTSKTPYRELTSTMIAPSVFDYAPLRFWMSRRR
jgi:hypothetical protein